MEQLQSSVLSHHRRTQNIKPDKLYKTYTFQEYNELHIHDILPLVQEFLSFYLDVSRRALGESNKLIWPTKPLQTATSQVQCITALMKVVSFEGPS